MKLGGCSVLEHVVRRAQAATGLDKIVVATTTQPSDDRIVEVCRRKNVLYYRGEPCNVLDRFYRAAQKFGAKVIVRITADCPLLDPSLLDKMLAHFELLNIEGNEVGYLSNSLERTFPRGLDLEVFPLSSLKRAFREASLPHELEHVTPYLYEHPELFKTYQYLGADDHSNLRLTLDTIEDFHLLEQIFDALHRDEEIFLLEEVIHLLERHPELTKINAKIQQKPSGT